MVPDHRAAKGATRRGRCKIGRVGDAWWWPTSAGELLHLQSRLAAAVEPALADERWEPSGPGDLLGGCFVVPARGTVGRGRAGDRVWAAAVAWRWPEAGPEVPRRSDLHLRGPAPAPGRPRRADDVVDQATLSAEAPGSYEPGLLALRDGAVLADVLGMLEFRPDVVVVDATGTDHPRGAGLAVHLGAVTGLATVGVTRRPLVASGSRPELGRGASSPLLLHDRCVAYWVCTRDGVQPLVAHAGWRTSPEDARRVALGASTPGARTPVPLEEARRVAREARSNAVAED